MNTQKIITDSLAKKYDNVEQLVKDVVDDELHALWIFAADYSVEILRKDENWKWLSYRVFDFSNIVIDKMRKDLNVLIHFSLIFKENKLIEYIEKNDVKNAVKWLLSRFVNELKNLFDKRSKKSLNIDNVNLFYFNSFENGEELISSSI